MKNTHTNSLILRFDCFLARYCTKQTRDLDHLEYNFNYLQIDLLAVYQLLRAVILDCVVVTGLKFTR